LSEPLPEQLSVYLDGLVPPRPPEMQLMERIAQKTGFPIIGPATGQLCYLLTRLLGARRVFELGSGYGYSTAWFARAVKENGGGEVYHVEWDDDMSQRARDHLAALGYDDVVRYHVGEGVQTLREMPGQFDVIFNDIDKQDYPGSLPVIADKLRPGGLLITDNLLYHNHIFDDADRSPTTEGVREFTRMAIADPAWISTVVPVRDGVLLAYKPES
jgi:predicted O-methyltransferase YrrM